VCLRNEDDKCIGKRSLSAQIRASQCDAMQRPDKKASSLRNNRKIAAQMKLNFPTKKKFSVQFDLFSVGKNLLTTEKVLEERIKEYVRIKEESREPFAMLELALKTLSLARLVANDVGEEIIMDAHCRVSEAYLLGGMNTQAMQHAYEAVSKAKHMKREPSHKVLMCLGRAFMATGNLKRAHDLFNEALLHLKAKYGPESVQQCGVLCEIAEAYWRENKQTESIDTLVDVWTIQDANFGSEAPELIPTYLHLGQAYCKRTEYDRALDHLLRALRISDEKGLTKTKMYAQTCVLISSCYSYDPKASDESKLRQLEGAEDVVDPDYGRALEYLQKGLDVYNELYGTDCKESAKILKEMAQLYLTINDYKNAAACMKGVLAAVIRRHGSESLEAAITTKRIGEMYMIDNQVQAARLMLKRSLEIFVNLGAGGRHNAMVQSIKVTLERIKLAIRANVWMKDHKKPEEAGSLHSTEEAKRVEGKDLFQDADISGDSKECRDSIGIENEAMGGGSLGRHPEGNGHRKNEKERVKGMPAGDSYAGSNVSGGSLERKDKPLKKQHSKKEIKKERRIDLGTDSGGDLEIPREDQNANDDEDLDFQVKEYNEDESADWN